MNPGHGFRCLIPVMPGVSLLLPLPSAGAQATTPGDFGQPNSLAPSLSLEETTAQQISLSRASPIPASGLVVDPGSLLWPPGTFGPTTTDAVGRARLNLPLPADPALAGVSVYVQGAVGSPVAPGHAPSRGGKTILR